MALNDGRQVDITQEGVGTGAPPVLICARCGGGFSVWLWQPRLRCPHCRMLGYPDRAMHNLLPLGWDCPNCGAANAASTNFCVTCGTGLTSRCLRCERPIYTAICPHCGAHQAAMLRYQIAQTRRVIWEPIVRARIQEQQVKEQAAQALPPEQEPASSKPSRQVQAKPQQRSGFRTIGGMALIALGFYLLEQQGIISFSQMFQSAASGITLPAWMVGIWNQAQTVVTSMLDWLATSPVEERRYLVMFATFLAGMVFLIFLVYLFDRYIIPRIFP